MSTPKELAAKTKWTRITLTVIDGNLPNPMKYKMLFEGKDASAEGETSVAEVVPTPHFADVCRYLTSEYHCPVRIDCGEFADPRYIQFDVVVDKTKKGK